MMGDLECRVGEKMPVARKTIYTAVIKRFLDIILSLTAVIILGPLLIVLVILELIFHGTPVLFAQERLGLNGEIFKLYKFRSMTDETDADGVLLPEERRVTNFGRVIRRLSFDELPELFCILKGDMSIIGPRPLLVRYRPLYSERHMHRHDVRPGFACVPLRPQQTWTWNDQFENDIWYLENCSFTVDVRMIFAVLREAVAGAEYRVSGVREEYNGKNLHDDAKNA